MEYIREMLGLVQSNLSQILSMANLTITLVDVIEILIISFLFYNVLLWIKSTRAWNLFKGIMVILLFVLLAAFFQMSTILWIAENTLNVGLIALVIIFQPELRNALEDIGGKNILGSLFVFNKTAGEKFSNHTIDELVKASFAMGKVKTGALIVIEDDRRRLVDSPIGMNKDDLSLACAAVSKGRTAPYVNALFRVFQEDKNFWFKSYAQISVGALQAVVLGELDAKRLALRADGEYALLALRATDYAVVYYEVGIFPINVGLYRRGLLMCADVVGGTLVSLDG